MADPFADVVPLPDDATPESIANRRPSEDRERCADCGGKIPLRFLTMGLCPDCLRHPSGF